MSELDDEDFKMIAPYVQRIVELAELEALLNKQWWLDEAERVGKIATERAEAIEIKDSKIAEIEAENVNLRARIQATQAILEPVIPAGMMLVPIEPTAQMIKVGNEAFAGGDASMHTVRALYKLMLNVVKDTT